MRNIRYSQLLTIHKYKSFKNQILKKNPTTTTNNKKNTKKTTEAKQLTIYWVTTTFVTNG